MSPEVYLRNNFSEIQPSLQDLARLEGEHAPSRDRYPLSGLRVPALTRPLLIDGERAESRYLYLLAPSERLFEYAEYELHHLSRFCLRDVDSLENAFNQVRLRHSPTSHRSLSFNVYKMG